MRAASICNGEQVAGFKDIHTGKIEEVIPGSKDWWRNNRCCDRMKKMVNLIIIE